MKKKLVILTGAGISQESGIKTFRDMGGLWEEYDVMEVATPEAWQRNPELVMKFYNDRRKQLYECHPNAGHTGLVDLEEFFDVQIITQNIDDLHERAGSSRVLHLHGELKKARSSDGNSSLATVVQKGASCAPMWYGLGKPSRPWKRLYRSLKEPISWS